MDIRDTTAATVPFTHRSDRYEDVINGELLAAKWSPDSNSFTAILKETSPASEGTELAHVKTYLQDIPGGVPYEGDVLQIQVEPNTPENKILTSRHVARFRHSNLGYYTEMTHWLSILVPESRIHELCNIS